MADGTLSAAETSWSGRACPKCGYVRRPSDANAAWQCPKCQAAYAKVSGWSALASAQGARSREVATDSMSDHSAYTLVAANAFALAIALYTGMTLRDMMLVYWAQSVVIGVSFFIRILALERFSVVKEEDYSLPWYRNLGAQDDDRQGTPADYAARVDPSRPWSKIVFAFFFLFHYGAFHAIYFLFLISPHGEGHPMKPASLVLCILGFAIHHAFSLAHHIRSDRQGRPNLSTLARIPYYRIFPMHATIILGGFLSGGGTGVKLFFGLLKTLADVVMHSIGHQMLRGGAPPPWARG